MKTSAEHKARLAFAATLLLVALGAFAWYALDARRHATYEIRTPDPVSGLIPDAPVEFHGVEIGRVTRVELVDPRSVRILLSLRQGVPVTAATVATITSRGLATRGFTGYVYVALEDAGHDARPLAAEPGEPYPLIATAPSQSASLDMTIGQVNRNVQAMTELLQAVLDPKTIASLKESADNLQQVSRTLAENNRRLATIVVNGDRASRQLEPLLKSSSETVTALQSQVLPEAYKTLSNLERLSNTLNSVATKVNRDPSILVRGSAAPPGPGESK